MFSFIKTTFKRRWSTIFFWKCNFVIPQLILALEFASFCIKLSFHNAPQVLYRAQMWEIRGPLHLLGPRNPQWLQILLCYLWCMRGSIILHEINRNSEHQLLFLQPSIKVLLQESYVSYRRHFYAIWDFPRINQGTTDNLSPDHNLTTLLLVAQTLMMISSI